MIRPRTRSPRNSSLSLELSPILAWESARSSSSGSAKRCPSRASSGARRAGLVDDFTDPVVADRERPFPEFPEMRVAIGRKEYDFRLTDEIFKRNITDIRTTVGGIVPIVPHHE